MTEALRPIGRTLPRRALPDLPTTDVRPAVRAVGARVGAEVRRPYHLGVLIGLSAGAYAVSLGTVTWLQASTEAATMAVRAPAVAAIEQLAAENDRLEQTLAAVRERLATAGGDYGAATAALADLEARLDTLTTAVGEIEGQSLRLPTRISLPSAPRAKAPAAVSKPSTQATTGASGG